MSSAGPQKKYHLPVSIYELHGQPLEQVQAWASDPNCIEQAEVYDFLIRRNQEAATQAQVEANRKALTDHPFDPRTEVSADAQYIARRVATHLWILFVAFPVVLAILFYLLVSK